MPRLVCGEGQEALPLPQPSATPKHQSPTAKIPHPLTTERDSLTRAFPMGIAGLPPASYDISPSPDSRCWGVLVGSHQVHFLLTTISLPPTKFILSSSISDRSHQGFARDFFPLGHFPLSHPCNFLRAISPGGGGTGALSSPRHLPFSITRRGDTRPAQLSPGHCQGPDWVLSRLAGLGSNTKKCI